MCACACGGGGDAGLSIFSLCCSSIVVGLVSLCDRAWLLRACFTALRPRDAHGRVWTSRWILSCCGERCGRLKDTTASRALFRSAALRRDAAAGGRTMGHDGRDGGESKESDERQRRRAGGCGQC